MPDIQAQTPDGVIHNFPDGTPDSVVDGVIKDYLSGKTQDPISQQMSAAAKGVGVASPGVSAPPLKAQIETAAPNARATRRDAMAQPRITPAMRKASPINQGVEAGLEDFAVAAPLVPTGMEFAAAPLATLGKLSMSAATGALGAGAGRWGVREFGGGQDAQDIGAAVGGTLGSIAGWREPPARVGWRGFGFEIPDYLRPEGAARDAQEALGAFMNKGYEPTPDPELERERDLGAFMNRGYKPAGPPPEVSDVRKAPMEPPKYGPVTKEAAKAEGALGKVGESGEPLPDVIRIPEPRTPLPTDRPGSMFSVPREQLPGLARSGAPGAGDVLKNIGVTTLYTVPEGNPEANAALGRIGKTPNFRIVPPAEAPARLPIAAAPREKVAAVAERFAPDIIQQAETEMRGLVDLGNVMPKAGRYFNENTFEEHPLAGQYDVKAGERPGGTWMGIKSQKGNIAGQFPWFNDKEMSLSKVQQALAQGKGAEYDRIVGKIAQRITTERSAASAAISEHVDELRQLAGQVQEIEPELARTLNDIADGKVSLAPDQMKAYVTEKIADATAARQFSQAIDDAAAESRSASVSETRPDVPPARSGSSEAGPATQTPELGRPLGRIRPKF